jgi:hypothetical protein
MEFPNDRKHFNQGMNKFRIDFIASLHTYMYIHILFIITFMDIHTYVGTKINKLALRFIVVGK